MTTQSTLRGLRDGVFPLVAGLHYSEYYNSRMGLADYYLSISALVCVIGLWAWKVLGASCLDMQKTRPQSPNETVAPAFIGNCNNLEITCSYCTTGWRTG